MQTLYYKQEEDHTCGAATARMAMNTLLNLEKTELFYADLLNTKKDTGTKREAFVALNQLHPRLDCQTGTNATLDTLNILMNDHYIVMVLYMLHVPHEEPVGHWAVVKNITATTLILQDPWMGPDYALPTTVFLAHWHSDPLLCNGVQDPSPWVAVKINL